MLGSLLSCNDASLAVALDTGHFHLRASVAMIPIEMLLDSGASNNFMSLDFVAYLGIAVTLVSAVQVRLADGSTLTTYGMITMSVSFSNTVVLSIEFQLL